MVVMLGLVPGIHVFVTSQSDSDVDYRDKPDHDGVETAEGTRAADTG
jgi:hypothetical protein